MTATHPLWRPFELADLDQVAAARLGPPPAAPVSVVDPDPAWPAWFARVEQQVRAALGDRVLAIEHVGSTAVPGLPAKPVVDVDLTVADPSREDDYVPALEATGLLLRLREPEWEEHRLMRGEDPPTNLHVFGPGAREPRRHVLFRDWLRTHPEDRSAYGDLKCRLARDGAFTDAMDYNNHKAALVYDIHERAFAADPQHPHDPRPRPAAPDQNA